MIVDETLVALAGLFPLGFLIILIREILGWGLPWGWVFTVLGAIVGGVIVGLLLILGWCIQTSYRLITGRPRKDGGLLSPLVLVLTGIIFVATGIFELINNGWQGLHITAGSMLGGVYLAALAWSQFRRQPQNADRPPNEQLSADCSSPGG